MYGCLLRPHECGLCTHHINFSCIWTLLGYNTWIWTFLQKEPPAEMSGYGPALVIFLTALATMKVWLRHCRSTLSISWLFRPFIYISPYTYSAITRGHNLRLRVPLPRIDAYKYSFFTDVVELWNSLPEHIVRAPNVTTFSRSLNIYMDI